MAFINNIRCCGVGEVIDLTDRCSLDSILRDAKEHHKGFLIAYFVKYKGEKKFRGQKLMDKMLAHGFKKSSRTFVNPNSGNVIQPLHYMMKKSERATVRSDEWF